MSPESNTNLRPPASTRPSADSEIRRRALPAWETVDRIIEVRTHNDLYLNNLYQSHRPIIREYYEVQFDIASRKGSDRLNEFLEKYDHERTMLPGSGFGTLVESEPWHFLRTHFMMVRQSLGLERKRTSKGFAKHERARKAAAR